MSSVTAEASSVPEQPTVAKTSYFAEIQSMMFGFGDARTPLPESVTLVETIVQQQLRSVITQAADVSVMRGSKTVKPEDIIFLMRKDRLKTHRLLKYLAVKDLKNSVTSVIADDTGSIDPQLVEEPPVSKKNRSCVEFLRSIDQTGELTGSTCIPVDIVKYERNVRAERSSRMLDEARYIEFVHARRASFTTSKSGAKFREWLPLKPDDTPKLSDSAFDILGYLAYETVAQLVDLALLVRQDSLQRPGQPFSRYIPGVGYSLRHNLESRQIESAPPLTPTEIREALRRYWNSPVGPTNLFSRSSSVSNRLLTC